MIWTGRIMSGLVILFLIFDGVTKLIKIDPVVEAFAQLGYPDSLALPIGIIVLACAALYANPQTAILGAILLTGLLGGAIASHVRVGDPIFTHVLFGAYLGVLAWGGLYLRDEKLRALLSLRH
ncbi:MAG: DoxX family protein [Proteobacteria bacterium]|nr:DoxX family protein [Pseudomonadota bacterium]MBI3497707.1 DoxX family protein [Pseudomonadota bacterium]